jgi:hypothetical protein
LSFPGMAVRAALSEVMVASRPAAEEEAPLVLVRPVAGAAARQAIMVAPWQAVEEACPLVLLALLRPPARARIS